MKKYERSEGFTLVEVLVVLVIITLLAGIVGVNVLHQPAQARARAAQVQMRNLQTALKIYHTEQGRFPTQAQGLDALVKKPSRPPVPVAYPDDGYLESRHVPVDPWGQPYIYLIPGREGEAYELICYGADGAPGGEDSNADISTADF